MAGHNLPLAPDRSAHPVLKYTLGGILAFVILATTGLVILAKVDDSDADAQPAPKLEVVIPPGPLDFATLRFERGRITELQVLNQRPDRMALSIQGEGVERLPELVPSHEVGSREPAPFILIDTSAGVVETAYVRFNRAGEFEGKFYTPGNFYVETVKIIVE